MKKIQFLPVALILLFLLAAGCTGTPPAGNTTLQPTASPVATLATTAALPLTGNSTPPTLLPTTVPPVVPVPEPVVTLTTKPIPPPTLSSIYIEGVSSHIFPLSFDSGGFITKGNITIQGVIESLSAYPLEVVMRGDIIGAIPPSVPRATAFDTVTITPHGISGFTLEMDDYVFNYRPDYAETHDTWNLTVENVSVAPS